MYIDVTMCVFEEGLFDCVCVCVVYTAVWNATWSAGGGETETGRELDGNHE